MLAEDARREVRYAAGRFFAAKREDLPLRVVLKRYSALYRAMFLARNADVGFDWINRTIDAAEAAR